MALVFYHFNEKTVKLIDKGYIDCLTRQYTETHSA